jgi:hypothetical protein
MLIWSKSKWQEPHSCSVKCLDILAAWLNFLLNSLVILSCSTTLVRLPWGEGVTQAHCDSCSGWAASLWCGVHLPASSDFAGSACVLALVWLKALPITTLGEVTVPDRGLEVRQVLSWWLWDFVSFCFNSWQFHLMGLCCLEPRGLTGASKLMGWSVLWNAEITLPTQDGNSHYSNYDRGGRQLWVVQPGMIQGCQNGSWWRW